jgi:hypothetical protein
MTGIRGRNLRFPLAARRIGQLAHFPFRREVPVLNHSQLPPRFQVLYGFRFESPAVLFTARQVFQSAARSEDRQEQHQYLVSCSRDSCSSFRVAPVANDESFKELSGLLSLTW